MDKNNVQKLYKGYKTKLTQICNNKLYGVKNAIYIKKKSFFVKNEVKDVLFEKKIKKDFTKKASVYQRF